MIVPQTLFRGNSIAIVAPARKVLPTDLQPSLQYFQEWGLVVNYGKNLHSDSHSYLAGSDAERIDDFNSAIADPSVKAIFCARGGYGVTRILDQIDFTSLLENPKWIVGFSDITALHLALYKHGLVSVHGTMPLLFDRAGAERSRMSLHELLTKGHHRLDFTASAADRIGMGEGPMVGGNLSLIVDSLGTASEIDTDGCILFLEEIDEYRYKIDRMFTQLLRAGKLDKLAGLVLGHFTDMKDSTLAFGETVFDIVNRVSEKQNCPIAFGFPAGHEEPNIAFLHGAQYRLEVSPSGNRLISRSLSI